MKKVHIAFLLVLMSMAMLFFTHAQAEMPRRRTVRVAISDEENIIIDRIIYTALSRLGYDTVVTPMGMKTAVISVDNGENDVLAVQALDIENSYSRLIAVPVPISFVQMVAYTKEGSGLAIDAWEDLIGLRVAYHPRNIHVENHIPAGVTTYPINDDEAMFQTLLDGTADVVVIPVTELIEKVMQRGIIPCGIIDTIRTYSFVNSSWPELAEQLTEEYAQMVADGTVEQIKSNTFSLRPNGKMVLHISSYSAEMLWEQKIIQGVQDALSGNNAVTYYNLSLNLRRLSNVEAQYELMEKAVHAAFIDRPPDVVVVSDNSALDFVAQYYSKLFHGIPVVYCGINNFAPDMIYGLEEHITGVSESNSGSDTVSQMLTLFPDTRHIYMLNDYSLTGDMCRKSMEKELEGFETDVSIHYNANLPVEDILREIDQLGENTLVLCGSYYTDSTGKYFSEQEISDMLGTQLNVPVFCTSIADVGFSTMLGGKVSDGYKQGYAAGSLAAELLSGKGIGELEIEGDPDKLNTWVFDYKALDRFGIAAHRLPKGHQAVNKDLSLFESNPVEATLLTGLLICLALVAGGFVIFGMMLRRKNISLLKIQKSLHTAEELLAKDDEIRRSQKDLNTLLDSVMQPVMVIDLETEKLLYVNETYVNTFAFASQEEAISHNIADISVPVQANGEAAIKRVREVHRAMAEQSALETFEWLFVSRTGRNIYARVMVNAIRFNDRSAYVALVQDITADREKNEMLEKAARLEREANAMKSQFVMNMSHELRTPMNAIIGLSQIALRKGFPPDIQEMFYKINRSGNLLLDLINDVLDFSKLEADKTQIISEAFELENMLSDVMMVAAPRIGKKPVDLQLRVDPRLPQHVLGDKTRIWQVLKNILDNSAKFTKQGSIMLEVALHEALPKGAVSISFCIRDTGAGMTQEQLSKLYEPFEQFEYSASMAVGTGLGMPITKQLVGLMNGSIEVKSEQGKGTKTTVILPLDVPPEAMTLRAYLETFELKGISVLLVGTDALLREAMTLLSESMGFSLSQVEDITQAIGWVNELAEPSAILVVADIEPAKEERERALVNVLHPALLLLDYERPLTTSEIRAMGFDAAIEKPLILSQASKAMYELVYPAAEAIDSPPYNTYPEASVLLVEDHEINQEVAASMLAFFGIRPMVAANGKEAIEWLERQPFDLVFMDLMMPVMGGHEATRLIRRSAANRDVPIIAMTANVVKEEIELCFQNGMNDHIGKPISVDVLSEKLKKWLK